MPYSSTNTIMLYRPKLIVLSLFFKVSERERETCVCVWIIAFVHTYYYYRLLPSLIKFTKEFNQNRIESEISLSFGSRTKHVSLDLSEHHTPQVTNQSYVMQSSNTRPNPNTKFGSDQQCRPINQKREEKRREKIKNDNPNFNSTPFLFKLE